MQSFSLMGGTRVSGMPDEDRERPATALFELTQSP